MNILHLIQTKQLRGAEVFTCQLANHLQQRGHQVKITALKEGNATLPFNGSVEVLHARLNHRFWDWSAWKQLARIIREFKPSVVQANAGDTLKYAVLSKLFFGWKQPIVFRNASTMSQYISNGIVRWMNKQLLSRTAHIASVSAFTQQDLINNLQIPQQNIIVIPTGIEATTMQAAKNGSGIKQLVHVGGFSFEKNHQGLIRIFQEVRKQIPDAQLILVGDGPLRSQIETLVHSLSLQDAVLFKGAVTQPLDLIASADVLLLPSILEGLPAVVLEAFYCGTPVVAYNAGGISELVTEQTGWLVNKNDETGFARQVVELLQSNVRAAINSKVQAASALVQQRYLNTSIAREFEQLYQQISVL